MTTVLGTGGSSATEATPGAADHPTGAGARPRPGGAATEPLARPRRGVVGEVNTFIARARDAVGILYREILKFGVVGAVAFVVDTGLFNLLCTDLWMFGGPPPLDGHEKIAKVISASTATLVSWLGNRHWSFRHRRQAAAHRELVLFAVMNVAGLLISVACLTISHDLLGFTSTLADNISGNLIGIGLGTLFRFWAYRRFVFTELRDPAAHGLAVADPAAEIAEDLAGEPRSAPSRSPLPGSDPGLSGSGPTHPELTHPDFPAA